MPRKKASARKPTLPSAAIALQRHFAGNKLQNLITANRQYPLPARVDLQTAIDELLPQFKNARQTGLHVEYSHETLTLGNLLGNRHSQVGTGPLQYEEVDIGELVPVRCVRRALWLAKDGDVPFALILGPALQYGTAAGSSIELVVPPGNRGNDLIRRVLDGLDARVRNACSYRGRVISLENSERYSGAMGTIRVHKLKRVERHQLILPDATIALLERNVIGFVEHREKLKTLGLPAKKGLLLYGPPGTGKTHTIHYLATCLPQHTTLLVTAEQVGLLEHYFQLARFLQPAILVLEDADLIARSREEMGGACEEALLNKLLNEMDGLREDAEIFFLLTTNRPEQIERALAARPGRIDQSIEFPLPDEDSRRRLAALYAGGLELSPEILNKIATQTKGGSAALIKELMRRAAQFLIESKEPQLHPRHVDAALDEMLFSGGSLNATLLGAVGVRAE